MLFNSWEFLTLLAITLPLYYLPISGAAGKVWQVSLLLVASAVFYAWEEPRLLILLSVSCLVNAVAVERILFWKSRLREQEGSHSQCGQNEGAEPVECAEAFSNAIPGSQAPRGSHLNPSGDPNRARAWLIATLALNLAFLAFFKYAGFIAGQLPIGWVSVTVVEWLRGIPLPVGISFYTFQGISLVVDVWRRDISENTAHVLSGRGKARLVSIRDSAFYISFFPQLVAGPIVKAHEFVDQIGLKTWRNIQWRVVRRCLIAGYFLKIFVADNLAEQTGALTLGAEKLLGMGPINLMCLLYGYSLQIFADFAGYSLIAIGLGALFGYWLPENFNFPYLSRSITEFWRRWHLSLSSWLRDYLYFPLGGNRKGHGRTYFNLFLVMVLGGLWHGAAWKFALWGMMHGVALAIERLVAKPRNSARTGMGTGGNELKCASETIGLPSSTSFFPSLRTAFQWCFTFHLVTILWLTFMMPDMASIGAFFLGVVKIFDGHIGFAGPPIFSLVFYGSVVVCYHVWGWLREHRPQSVGRMQEMPLMEGAVHAVMLFLLVSNPGAPRGFIYFQF